MPLDKILASLDELPVFTLANEFGVPLRYATQPGDAASGASAPNTDELEAFFVDAAMASAELTRVHTRFPDRTINVLPVGLGRALSRTLEPDSYARLIPRPQDVNAAIHLTEGGDGDYGGELGDLPVFGCYQLRRQRPDGLEETPLFLQEEDARSALSAAAGAGLDSLRLRSSSLAIMCGMMGRGEVSQPRAMRFVAPNASLRYLAERATGTDSEPPAKQPLSDTVARLALTKVFDGNSYDSNGIFPQ